SKSKRPTSAAGLTPDAFLSATPPKFEEISKVGKALQVSSDKPLFRPSQTEDIPVDTTQIPTFEQKLTFEDTSYGFVEKMKQNIEASQAGRSQLLPKPEDPRKERRQRIDNKVQEFEQLNELLEVDIKSLVLRPMTNEEIIRMCGDVIINPEPLTSLTDARMTSPGYLHDPQLGASTMCNPCRKCNKNIETCPGHWGMIQLVKPIINHIYIQPLLLVLSSVCHNCSRLLIKKYRCQTCKTPIDESLVKTVLDPEAPRVSCINQKCDSIRASRPLSIESFIEKVSRGLRGINRLKKIADLSKNVSCPANCRSEKGKANHDQGIITTTKTKVERDNKITIMASSKNEQVLPIWYKSDPSNPADVGFSVEIILKNITYDDAKLLGFEYGSHPINYLLYNIPVSPVRLREPRHAGSDTVPSSETKTYNNIITYNSKLTKALLEGGNYDSPDVVNFYDKLFISFTKLWNGDPNDPNFKGIKTSLGTKKGLLRTNVGGKRTKFSGRTVIGPDSTLKFGEVGIPEKMSETLTVPELVTNDNIAELTELIRNGSASTILRRNGLIENIKPSNKYYLRPEIGDTVNRNIRDGDPAAFNRQPSLHKYSIIGYVTKIIPGSLNIRITPASTKPHNADFDGDESVVHIAQTPEGALEIKYVMGAKYNVIGTHNNNPLVGLILDHVTSMYRLTNTTNPVTVPSNQWFDCLSVLTYTEDLPTLEARLSYHGVPLRSGAALVSALFPEDFSYIRADNVRDALGHKKKKNIVIIRNGVLIKGQLTGSDIGPKSGGIIQAINTDYGADRVAAFITDAQFLMNQWDFHNPFTIGIDDIPRGEETVNKLEREKQRLIDEITTIAKPKGQKLLDIYERKVVKIIDAGTNKLRKLVMDSISPSNSFKVMAKSGAKGSDVNAANILAALGQQMFLNKRVGTYYRRIAYYSQESNDPRGFGMIVNSYASGLMPGETYMTHQAGRENIIDTAISTAEVGTVQRVMAYVAHDIRIDKDGSVRLGRGKGIVMFIYGFDISKLENQEFPTDADPIPFFMNINRAVDRLNSKAIYEAT
ncbi:MAG: hypothetical protein P0116_15935, partial [Candidatus Nitrosocosmicus sp.]|nr:hypothetical protein [Candidatus Nitrosocosmicus sp.]